MKQILFLMITLWLSAGCLRENRSGCSDGLLVKFHYITSDGLSRNSGSLLTDYLSVFVFNENGLFTCVKKDSATPINDHYTMLLPLYEGQYQFVTWAGLSDSYTLSACHPNQTRIEDFILRLRRDPGNKIPISPSLLYQGWHETVTLHPYETTEITIGLQRITNSIQVIVHYATPEISPAISIEDNNGAYNYRGEIISEQLLYYSPHSAYSPDSANTWTAHFNIMRLQDDSDARLKIYNSANELQYNESLITGLLGAHPDINFNTDHDFIIEISLDSYYIPVSIQINGWEIIPEDIN